MNDLPNYTSEDDTIIYDTSKFNLSIDNKNYTDIDCINIFSFNEGYGKTIRTDEFSYIDSPKISKRIFNLMCITDHKRLKK